jgi:hypothetical protein
MVTMLLPAAPEDAAQSPGDGGDANERETEKVDNGV